MNKEKPKSKPIIDSVAVVGTGVIGRSWMKLLARAGCQVQAYDQVSDNVLRAMAWLEEDLARDTADGLLSRDEARLCLARVTRHESLAGALAGVGWVQESCPENLQTKQAIYAELDSVAPPDAIIGSSTASLDMTLIADGLPGRARCVVAHPTNPPHVAPAVEIVPGRDTDPRVVPLASSFITSVGQTPVVLTRYVPGFVLNRLQAAMLREAIALVAEGVAEVEAVDAIVRDGPGLRWALMGPFGVADTNADGGVRQYLTRYAPFYTEVMNDLRPTPKLDSELIEKVGRGTDDMLQQVSRSELCRWRDDMMRAIINLKKQNPPPWRKE